MTQEQNCAQIKEDRDTQNHGIAHFHVLLIKLLWLFQDLFIVHVSCY